MEKDSQAAVTPVLSEGNLRFCRRIRRAEGLLQSFGCGLMRECLSLVFILPFACLFIWTLPQLSVCFQLTRLTLKAPKWTPVSVSRGSPVLPKRGFVWNVGVDRTPVGSTCSEETPGPLGLERCSLFFGGFLLVVVVFQDCLLHLNSLSSWHKEKLQRSRQARITDVVVPRQSGQSPSSVWGGGATGPRFSRAFVVGRF